MKSAEDIKRYFQKATLSTNPDKHDAIFEKIQSAQNSSTTDTPVSRRFNNRRILMKSPITKVAIAAVIIIAVTLGLFEFIDTGSTSGVVWAEVLRKVQDSRGVVFRGRETMLDSQDDKSDYMMNYLSSTQSRHDSYEGDQIIKTFYDDYNTKTVVFIDHNRKSYIKKTFEEMEQPDLWKDPKRLIQKFLSYEHRELGQKTVEGVLCEGIETTNPSIAETDSQIDRLTAKIWVSVDSRYPVRLEVEVVANKDQVRFTAIVDQFQWDVELDESIFEPNIPEGYMQIPAP